MISPVTASAALSSSTQPEINDETQDNAFSTLLDSAQSKAAGKPASSSDKETDAPAVDSPPDSLSSTDTMRRINQLLLDARLGIDRRKLEEIEKEMAAVAHDSSLTAEQKQQKLAALQSQKEQLIEAARERAVEEEKRKAALVR